MAVVLVGKPNAGKSSLFNTLVDYYDFSVVGAQAGITRDWKRATSKHGWSVVDTPGIEGFQKPSWWSSVDAKLYLWVVDSGVPLSDLDVRISQSLRGLPVILCANKSDLGNPLERDFGMPVAMVSAKTGAGIKDLLDMINKGLPSSLPVAQLPDDKFMIIGQPNAGKSSLVNALSGSSRVAVSDVGGTTVDVVDVECKVGVLSDTPGIKRREYDGFMYDAVSYAIKKVRNFRGVLLLVVDATKESVSQDLRLARFAWSAGNPVLILLNKCDSVGGNVSKRWTEMIARALPNPLILQVSAHSGKNLDKIFVYANKLHKSWLKRISTPEINKWCESVIKQKIGNIKYITQTETAPPKLVISGRRLADKDYKCVCKEFRKHFEFNATPIRVGKKFY